MDTINILKNKFGNSPDFVVRTLSIKRKKINIYFFETLCNTKDINDFILSYLSYLKVNNKRIINIYKYINEYIPSYSVKEVNNIKDVIDYLFSGFLIMEINNKFIALEFRKQLDSGISVGENEKTIKGPKDSFTENYQTNIGLIRKRIRNSNVWLEEVKIGAKSNIKVGVMYIKDIANTDLVNNIMTKLKEINIDSIPDSNYIYEYIRSNNSIFPSVLSTERPDLASYKLLDGKVAIIVENTPFVILLPTFFIEFFHTMDDYYQSNKNALYTRIIRIIGFFVSVSLTATYIALITYNHEIIPPDLLINFAAQKDGVPFPTIIESFVLGITFEILRETDIRSPSTVGSALSIVGALVLGDAAVKAGLVSPIMVIVVALTSISEMIFNITDISNSIKLWRLLFLIMASTAGMLGVFIAFIMMIAEICSIDSFGVPYLYPISPYDYFDNKNNIVLKEKYKMSFRNKLTAFKNRIRGKYEDK